MPLWTQVLVYYVLLVASIVSIVTLTLRAGMPCLQDESEKDKGSKTNGESRELVDETGNTEEEDLVMPKVSPKTGGEEPWYR